MAEPMQVSISDAKAQLTDLVRRAEAGDEIVLTRHGRPAVRLVPMRPMVDAAARRAAIAVARRAAASPGPSAARSQDALYGDDGLPS